MIEPLKLPQLARLDLDKMISRCAYDREFMILRIVKEGLPANI